MLQAANRAQTLRPQSAPWIIHAPVSQWEHLWLVWNNTQLCCTASGKTSLRVQCLRHLVPARESKKASRMAASLSLPPLFCFTLVINFLLFSLCSQLPHYRSGLLNKTDMQEVTVTRSASHILFKCAAISAQCIYMTARRQACSSCMADEDATDRLPSNSMTERFSRFSKSTISFA